MTMTNDFIDDAIDSLNSDGRQYILIVMDESGCRYSSYIEEPDNVRDYMQDEGFDMILELLEESRK